MAFVISFSVLSITWTKTASLVQRKSPGCRKWCLHFFYVCWCHQCEVTSSVKRYPTTPAAICRRRTAVRIPRNYRNQTHDLNSQSSAASINQHVTLNPGDIRAQWSTDQRSIIPSSAGRWRYVAPRNSRGTWWETSRSRRWSTAELDPMSGCRPHLNARTHTHTHTHAHAHTHTELNCCLQMYQWVKVKTCLINFFRLILRNVIRLLL